MESLNFWIGFAGLALGLISAWPRLARWFNSARGFYSDRAKRNESKLLIRYRLAISDPVYLIAYTTQTLAVGAGFFWLGSLVRGIEFAGSQLELWAVGIRLTFSLVGGAALGNVLGLAVVIIRHKEKSAQTDA